MIQRRGFSDLIVDRSMEDQIKRFTDYDAVSNAVLEQASKDEIADAADESASRTGHYRTRYNDLPTTTSLHLLYCRGDHRRSGGNARK